MSRLLTEMTATAVNSARSSGAHTAHPTTNGSMYAYAYMLPFVVGCAVCAPDERALLTAVAVISVNNLLIHTPALEVLPQQL